MLLKIIETIFSKGISALCNFLILLISTHYLGATGRGEMAILVLGIALVGILQSIASGAVITYLIPRFSAKKLIFVATTWNALLALLLAPILVFFDLFPTTYLYHLMGLSFLVSSIALIQCSLLGKERIRQQNLLEILKAASTVLGMGFFIIWKNEPSIDSVVAALFLAYSFTLAIALRYLAPILRETDSKKNDLKTVTWNVLKIGSQMQLNNISQLINYRFCFYLIEKTHGLAALGVFSVATSLAEMVWIICKSVSNIHYSKTVNVIDKQTHIQLTTQLTKLSFILTLPILTVLLVIPDSIHQWIFGLEFNQFQSVLWTMAPGIVFLAIFTILNHHFSGIGRNLINLSGSLIGNLATVVVGFLAVPSLGNYGGGIATSAGYLVMLLFWIWKFNQINNLKYNWLIIKPTEIKSIFNLSKFGN